MIRNNLSAETQKRFWDKVNKAGPNDCWEWTAGKNEKGYGVFGVGKDTDKAHRLSYRLMIGEIAKGLFVLHSCDNPGCVNPSHLRPGTNRDNVNDMISRRRNSRPPPMAGHNKIIIPDACILLMGKMPDHVLGTRFAISKKTIMNKRRALGIPSYAASTGKTGRFTVGMEHPRWG